MFDIEYWNADNSFIGSATTNPQITEIDMTPFATTYSHDGLMLKVTGDADQDDCWITKVTVSDSKIDISDLFSAHALDMMAESIHNKLTNEAREEAAEMRIERHEWHREFSIAA